MTIDSGSRTHLLGSAPRIPAVCSGKGVLGLVSVIIPTYNRAYIVGQAIESVLAQTYPHVELIVIDDGSTDDTRAAVERYGDRVRYVFQDNAGLASGRNNGLSLAHGEFVAFQDSDDTWHPWKLEAQIAVMREFAELAMVWTNMTAVTPSGRVVREKHLHTMYDAYDKVQIKTYMSHAVSLGALWEKCPSPLSDAVVSSGNIFGAMFFGNLVHPPSALIRRQAVAQAGGLDVALSWTCEDYEFFWRLAKFGKAACIDASSMLYRVDAEDQLTKPALHLDMARGNLIVLQRYLRQELPRIDLSSRQARQLAGSAHAWVAEEMLAAKHMWPSAVWHLLRSVYMNPRDKRAVWLLALSLAFPGPLFGFARKVKGLLPA
jgi:glycosyltransferase involved in cell wall biosynthesis